jgi:YYY domain-containing protein
MGGYSKPEGIQQFLVNEYNEQSGSVPLGTDMDAIIIRAENPSLYDRLRYELSHSLHLVSSLAQGFGRVLTGERLGLSADRWFWGPSRVLADTPGVGGNAITEMPAFTFIYGDMHAHMISMPMQLFALMFLFNEVVTAGDAKRRWRYLAIVIGGIMIGMMRATNTWDWITYILFGVAGLGFAWWLRIRALHWGVLSRRSLMDAALTVGGFVVIHFIAVFPYSTWFVTSYSSVKLWTEGKTPLWAYFDIHGLFLFLIVSFLAWDTARWFRATKVTVLRGKFSFLMTAMLIAVLGFVAVVALSALDYQVTLVALPLILWAVILFFRDSQSRPMQFVLAAGALGLALTLGVEYIVLDGDIDRQNTVFKFYLQAWLLFSVVSGVAFAALIRGLPRWNVTLRSAWTVLIIILIGAAALFPIMATLGKAAFRFDLNQPLTLDGMEFMRYATQYEGSQQVMEINPDVIPFRLENDYHMVRWLQENIQGSPIIIEGMSEGTEYHWNGRVSIYTGLPTVIGWRWHQTQQHTLNEMGRQIDMRVANVNAFYQTTDINIAWDILRFYDVQYIIVGDLERAYYLPQGLDKFNRMVEMGLLEIVYEQGTTAVYRVNTNTDVESAIQAVDQDVAQHKQQGQG